MHCTSTWGSVSTLFILRKCLEEPDSCTSENYQGSIEECPLWSRKPGILFCVCVTKSSIWKDWISGPSMAACGEVVSNLGKNELISPPTVIPALMFSQGFPFVRLLTCLGISKMCGHCFYLGMRKSGIWVASGHEEIAEGWTGSYEMLWGLGSAKHCPLQLQSHPEKICCWEARSKGPQWESGRSSGAGPDDHGMWQTFWGEWKAPTTFLPYSSWNSISWNGYCIYGLFLVLFFWQWYNK